MSRSWRALGLAIFRGCSVVTAENSLQRRMHVSLKVSIQFVAQSCIGPMNLVAMEIEN